MEYIDINKLIEECIKERNNPCEKTEAFSKALIDAENALRELKRFY